MSVGKKIADNALTGDTGIALIHTVVGQMRHVWREWNGSLDAGIDGSIELRDPASGEVTNKHVLVQSKASTVPFAGEDEQKFTTSATTGTSTTGWRPMSPSVERHSR